MPWQAVVKYSKPDGYDWAWNIDSELNEQLLKVVEDSKREAGGFISRDYEVIDRNNFIIRTVFETEEQLYDFIELRTMKIDAFRSRMMELMEGNFNKKVVQAIEEV